MTFRGIKHSIFQFTAWHPRENLDVNKCLVTDISLCLLMQRTMKSLSLPLCSASKALTSLDLEKFPKTRQASTIASMFSGISKEISTATRFARNMLLEIC